jgi:hypothetical protein
MIDRMKIAPLALGFLLPHCDGNTRFTYATGSESSLFSASFYYRSST